MKDLIPISNYDGKRAVSARHLHSFLECKKQFTDWVKHRIQKYGFVENVDYQSFSLNGENGGRNIEYALTLDCAKELAMVEGNAKGKQARQYFIACEKQIKDQQNSIPQSFSEALMLAARQAEQIELQTKQLSIAAPKVEYFDDVLQSKSLIATNVIAKELCMSAISLNRKLHELGVIYNSSGTWVLYQKYQDKGYTGTKTHVYIDNLGHERTNVQTYWTESGRKFIHELLKKQKIA
jgi:anti-repressor protein